MPLSCGGLWLAVIMMPACAPAMRVVKESCGVERSSGKSSASMPSALSDFAAAWANCAREKARVVRDDHAQFLARIALEQIGAERGNGAVDVAEVEHVRAGAGKFGAVERLRLARLGLGHDLADGAAAHAAGAEGDVAEEAVVELGPRLRREQFVDAGAVDRGGSGIAVNARDVLLRGGEKFRLGFRGESEGGGHIPKCKQRTFQSKSLGREGQNFDGINGMGGRGSFAQRTEEVTAEG